VTKTVPDIQLFEFQRFKRSLQLGIVRSRYNECSVFSFGKTPYIGFEENRTRGWLIVLNHLESGLISAGENHNLNVKRGREVY
jgi:hypothetical protein